MVRFIQSYDECRDFAAGLFENPQGLAEAIGDPEGHCVLGVYRGEQMIGLFSFLLLRDERYMELLAGQSREREAYPEMLSALERHFPGYGADFVFNQENTLLKQALERRGAAFDPEQQKMVLRSPVSGADTAGVEPLSNRYAAQYCAMHDPDMYWTGERVMQAQDRFRTLLAVEGGRVVGYLDATYPFPENEVFDLLVLEEYRRRGYGRRLLAKAVEENAPNGMMLLVNVDNAPAIGLYESMGFETVPGRNSLTAHWTVPGAAD